jgi:fructose-1,6-bisphosphatase I
MTVATLHSYLEGWARTDTVRVDVATTVDAIAAASIAVADLISRAPLLSGHAPVGVNADGDEQSPLDVMADSLITDALRMAPVAALASEEQAQPVRMQPGASLAVALDPLDGSSSLATNVSAGTIFGIVPTRHAAAGIEDPFRQPGSRQLAAGFAMYGPQTVLVLTLGDGVDLFVHTQGRGFVLARRNLLIPAGRREYAINGSNRRHWDDPIRHYVDDCVAGMDGPRRADFNARWLASLVAEAYRILGRGGIFLYPADRRPGYANGRLRLLYEANPIALLAEQAGGAATDGRVRILDIEPGSIHERVPLAFGAADEVERFLSYRSDRVAIAERSPLFGRRGLLRV